MSEPRDVPPEGDKRDVPPEGDKRDEFYTGYLPPLFILSDPQGPAAYLMLVGADGRAVNQEVLDMIVEPLEITGDVSRLDNLWILRADPAGYRRLL